MSFRDLNAKDLYLNRELSLLQFNHRVLKQAENESLPLLERLRFLCIFNSNIDEFFEVRVAGLVQDSQIKTKHMSIDGRTPDEALTEISQLSHQLADEQYEILNKILLPELEKNKIFFLKQNKWTKEQQAWTRRYFKNDILPVLTPIGLDLTHPFPRLVNKTLNFIVSLEGKDAFGRDSGLAVIHAPRTLPRVLLMPSANDGRYEFVLLSTLVSAYADMLFPGMSVTGCYQFRLTRNSELFVDEERSVDLIHEVEGKLSSRRFGQVVRLELDEECPLEIARFLLKKSQLREDFLFLTSGMVNISRLTRIFDYIDNPDLFFEPFTAGNPNGIATKNDESIFDCLKKRDILLHHPYQNFSHVENFIQQASLDSNVLAIKITLYRSNPNSALIDALVAAAKAGKEITAVIEIRARFDEAGNIRLANRLQEAGALVVYGVVDYKTHAKMILVTRRESSKKIRHYVHLGTGNYHPTNASLYADYGLLTSGSEMVNDVFYVFQQLTGMGRASRLKKLLTAPFTLHKALLQHIQNEIDLAKAGKPAHIIMKMNGLTEKNFINALYEASIAGVKIDLIVRGVCCLRPGIKGLSENIKVRSIIGRFLEHSRIYFFQNDGDNKLYLSSADSMERNFFKRVEVGFPIEDKTLLDRIKNETLNLQLKDNTQSWQLQSDGSYKANKPASNQQPICAQQTLLESLTL